MAADKGPNPWQLSHIGFEFAAAVLLLALGGWWLDEKLGSEPWFMLIGALLGGAAGMYRLMKIASPGTDKNDKNKRLRK